ncbi:MAG TPA: RsmE family RNA methyltransferase [Gemmatimonadales bacterium]|jgi:16S rRNA (uracil1498-N3)-methyltransferase
MVVRRGAMPMSGAAVLAATELLVDGGVIDLDDDERHHLQVRRVSDGATVRVFDGEGGTAAGVLRHAKSSATVTISNVHRADRPAPTVLAIGAGDKDRFIALAERATELGVTELIPVEAERARDVAGRVRAAHLDRMRRRAREACKQCGNPWATTIVEPLSFEQLIQRYRARRWLVADHSGGAAPGIGTVEAIGWIIGPEGGLTPDEMVRCRETLGAVSVTLGPSILRFDTAAIVAAGLTIDRRLTAER